MKLTIEIDTGDMASLQSLYDVARAMMGISGDAPAKPASPPKAAAPTAQTTTTAPASSTAPAAAPLAQPQTAAVSAAAAPTADVPSVDLAGLSSLFQTFVKAKGPGAAKALLTQIGVSKVVDIPPDQFGAFAAKLAV